MTALKYNIPYTTCLIILSHQIFQGFNFTVSSDQIKNLTLEQQSEFVNKEAKRLLKEFFYSKNLYVLCEDYVNQLNVHLHQLLDDKVDNYACDHCHGYSDNNKEINEIN
jgi:hypothetical protein